MTTTLTNGIKIPDALQDPWGDDIDDNWHLLDEALDATIGHTHSGTAGNGPILTAYARKAVANTFTADQEFKPAVTGDEALHVSDASGQARVLVYSSGDVNMQAPNAASLHDSNDSPQLSLVGSFNTTGSTGFEGIYAWAKRLSEAVGDYELRIASETQQILGIESTGVLKLIAPPSNPSTTPAAGTIWLWVDPSTHKLCYKTQAGTTYTLDIGQTAGDARWLQSSNNLSDLASASTARTNLGLGTAATQASSAFAAASHTHAAADVTSGVLAIGRLATGTPDGTKFVRDDGTLAVPAGTGFANPMTTQDDLIVGGASGAATRLAKGTDGQVLTVDPTTHHLVWTTPSGGGGGSGTVTSVALTVPSDLSVSGSPVTTSGTLAITRATQSANQVLAGPTSGGAATPGYRALVAADIPAIAESGVTNLTTDLAAKAPLASPALTGTPTAPTAAVATNTTQLATTAFVQSAIAGPGARVTHSANISIPATTDTTLTFDTERWDTNNCHFTSSAALTGTVAKTASSATLTGTGTSFTTELSVGQVIDVPGTGTETRVVTAIASNTSLTVSSTFANTASGQTATRVNRALVCQTAGTYIIGASLRFASSSVGSRTLSLYLNGTDRIAQINQAAMSATMDMQISTVYSLALWDYLTIVVNQDSGGSLNVTQLSGTNKWSPEFWLQRVG